MHFPVSGVDVNPFIPPLVAFIVSSMTAPAGVSGAFLLLPFQVSVLHYTSPSVSPTNLIYNIVAIPGGLYRFIKEGRMAWPLTWVVIVGTLPGVFLGSWVRIVYLPDPRAFKLFVGLVLLYLGLRLAFEFTGLFLNYAAALVVILALNFALPRLMPGDPLQAIYGDEAMIAMTTELKEDIIRRFSLDMPPDRQFRAYIASLLRGDLGHSYFYNAPVVDIILGRLPWTALLAGLALVISVLAGAFLGIESGYRRGRPADGVLLAGMMSMSGFPDFFAGILLLLLFGVGLGLAPLAGAVTPYAGLSGMALFLDVLHHLALPLASLVIVRMTAVFLLTRNTMVLTMGEAFIRTARAKGCPEAAVRYRHAGRSSLLPVVTAAGLQLSHLVSGTLFVEIVFSYPGMGTLLYNALLTRDYPLMQGVLLLVTVAVLAVNLLVDLLYRKIDPRVSHAY